MAIDYSQLQTGRLNSEQAKNMAELVTTYMAFSPTTNGQYNLDGLANYIQQNGLPATVDYLRSNGVDFAINAGTIKTPYPVAKELVDRLYKDANFNNPKYYQNWLNAAQSQTVEELINSWNNAGHSNPTTARSKITPEETTAFTTRAQEELPKIVQSDLNNFIQSANKIYQGYDLTPNYGPETDVRKLVTERLNQAGYNANQTDIDRWNSVAERYGAGAAIAQIDRTLALRNMDKAIPSFAQGEGFEGVRLTGQLPSTYAGSSQYKDINYAGTIGNPLLQQAQSQQALVPLSSVPATSVNPLVGTGSTTVAGIPIQGVPQPTLPQTFGPTNIPIQGVPLPTVPAPRTTDSFIQSQLQPQPQPQPQPEQVVSAEGRYNPNSRGGGRFGSSTQGSTLAVPEVFDQPGPIVSSKGLLHNPNTETYNPNSPLGFNSQAEQANYMKSLLVNVNTPTGAKRMTYGDFLNEDAKYAASGQKGPLTLIGFVGAEDQFKDISAPKAPSTSQATYVPTTSGSGYIPSQGVTTPQPLVGTIGGASLLGPMPQPMPQPQPQMTNEEFIQQQQAPVQMADGGSVGSASSGVRRLKMSGYQDGGDVSNDEYIQEMMTGTLPTDQGTNPGILPPEVREAIDVPLDLANLLVRGMAAVPAGGFAGLYKGLTGGKYGTQEGVKEADIEAGRVMSQIMGEPKTQAAKDLLQFIGEKAQEYKLDAALPQLLTLPSPGPGTGEFIKRGLQAEFETPPTGAVDIGALMPKPKKGVELSEQEIGKLIESAQVSDEQAPALVETAKRVKEIFNTNKGWEPIELVRAKIKPGKEDNFAVDLEAQKIPYNFHIAPEGIDKPAWEKKISNGIVGEVRKVVERAKAGDQAALDILSQASWYRSMRNRLRTEFGSIGDVFADVLGTTSAQTGVEQNFNNAVEILRRFSRGDYDKELRAYEDRLKSGQSMDGTELTKLHKQGEFPLITKASGALFNANSPSSMGALLDMFRSVKTGDSPKTPNFTGNLIGLTNEATIDVWAARLLRRLSGQRRIPPMAEKGVSGKHLVGSTLYEPKVGGEFGFGQKVFKDAANRINKTGLIKNFDPNIGDVGPDDLQAIAWFIEKERWTDNGWTSKAGEGGSLEYEMSFAGAPNQAMVNELRREINKGFKEPPQRKKETKEEYALRVDAARQAYDANRQDLINQLSLLKKDVDRYQVGLSGERPGKPLASGYQRAELAAEVDDVVRDDPSVITYNLTNTYGSFMSEVERALNGEFVVRGDFDPTPLERRVVELGKEYDQDAVFLSKVLPDGTNPNARPGIEIYFKEKVSPEQMAKVTERLRNYGVDGFTYVTDMRFSDRPGMQVRAGSPETAELTGLRFQYVPEFDDAYTPETRAAIIAEKEDLYRKILRDIMGDGNVSDARMLYYDTNVFFRDGYDEYLTRTAPTGSGRVRAGQPDSTNIAQPAQGAAVGAELPGDVRDGRNQASAAPAAAGGVKRRGKGTTTAAEDLAAVSSTAPAVSRLDMNYKDVTKRVPELTQGAKDLFAGKISRDEWENIVNTFKPVTPYETVPAPATAKQALQALTKTNRERPGDPTKETYFGVPSKTLKKGDRVGVRLDIPSYTQEGEWIVTVHEPRTNLAAGGAGKRIGYETVAALTDVDFGINPKGSAKIASGDASKSTIATMEGSWNPMSPKEAKALSDKYLNDPEWAQVGMDPERHSYFYDRATMEPVVSAGEVIQIGPLVLAKNVKYANKAEFKYKNGGEVTAFIKAKAR